MTGIAPSSSSNFGKRPDWRLTAEQISRLPSLIDGIDQAQELKLRQQAAQFIQDMAERLNHNVQQRGKINQVCICVSMVHMHRFFVIHSFRIFDPRDVAAACLFLAGKSEECPRKLEHIVEAWFKLKNIKAEVQPPFTESVRRDGGELIVFLESVLLQTLGFDLQVELPHPLVLHHLELYAQGNFNTISRCAYWFASEMIRLTTFPVRYSIQTIACLSIFLVSLWSDLEIPDSNGVPWFKNIEPEMTLELLNKLADEFTLLYHECGSSECRKAVEALQRLYQSSTASTSNTFMVHQLPPPPPPPNLNAVKPNQQQQHHQPQKHHEKGPNDQQRQPIKRPARTGPSEELTVKRIATDAVSSLTKVSRTAIPGDKQLPHPIKLEPSSASASNNSPSVKHYANEQSSRDGETTTDSTRNETTPSATKKKISLNEYKQRLKMKQEPVVDELF